MLERKHGDATGHFITAKEIEAMAATRVSQVVETSPSIVIRRVGNADKFAINGKTVGGAECTATVYLDGIRLNSGGSDRRGRYSAQREVISIDDYVTPNEIAGVEVYSRGALAPVQFQPASDASALLCAIVVFWTKHS